MKAKFLFPLSLLSILLILIYGFGGDAKYPGGSPGGYTGSPGDGKDCTSCHEGSASQVSGWITSNIPVDGYIPGETYTIFLSVTGSGDKGFEVSPQAINGTPLGTVLDGQNVHLVAGNTAVTQDDATSANPAEWQFNWTAPEAGTGDVTFYGAFTLNKEVTKLSTYSMQENAAVSVIENQAFKANIYPNPASNFINISYFAETQGKVLINLVSTDGRFYEIYQQNSISSGQQEILCNIPSDVSPGIYVLQIQLNEQYNQLKLIIR